MGKGRDGKTKLWGAPTFRNKGGEEVPPKNDQQGKRQPRRV